MSSNTVSVHYEKVVLSSLLLVFIGVLCYLVFTFDSGANRPINNDDVAFINGMSDNYTRLPNNAFTDSRSFWGAVVANRGKSAYNWSGDLFIVPSKGETSRVLLRCTACNALIPYADYVAKECSWCKSAIKPGEIVDLTDTDGDTIPDTIEVAMGTDPKRPDAEEDKDGDGFTNYEEYVYAKAQSNPKLFYAYASDMLKHPPLTAYLAVESVEQEQLNFELTKVSSYKIDTAVVYTAQYKTYRYNSKGVKGRASGGMKDEGEIITIPIVGAPKGDKGVEYKMIEVRDGDEPYVKLQDQRNPNIVITVKAGEEKVWHPQRRVILKSFLGEGEKYKEMILDDVVKVGNNTTGVESYKIVEIGTKEAPSCALLRIYDDSVAEYERIEKEPIVVTSESLRDSQGKGVLRPGETPATRAPVQAAKPVVPPPEEF